MPTRRKFFRWMDGLEAAFNEPTYNSAPAPQREDDTVDFLVATTRERPTVTMQDFVAKLEQYNRPRMARIRRDRKWLAKQFAKAGFNPEDSRLIP